MSNTSNPTTILMVPLPGGHWVQKVFLEELRRQVMETIPGLQFGMEYKIQHLVDAAYWSSLVPRDRRMAGRCLAYLVSSGQLPLEFVSCPRCTNKVYRRI